MNRIRSSLIASLIFGLILPGLGWSQGVATSVAVIIGDYAPGKKAGTEFLSSDDSTSLLTSTQAASAPASPPPWEEPLLPGPVYSSRELIWRSSLIVMLKVDKAGDLLVDRVLLGSWDARTPPPLPAGIVWQANAIRGIGFWRRAGNEFELLPSGLRSQGPADSVEYATPKVAWRSVLGADWPATVKNVQTDLEQILELKAAWGEVQAPKRIEKIQNWVSRHEPGLGGGIVEGQGTGWGSLEQHALMEIIQSADLELAWKAVGIYARTNEGYLPPCGPTFGTPMRRAFLMGMVQSPARLGGEKARALRLLGSTGVWKEMVTAEETKRFNELLLSGLKQQVDPVLFEAARDSATSLATANPGVLTITLRDMLKDLYQKQESGPRKAALAKAVAAALGNDQWKVLSGNDAGMVVAFTQLSVKSDRIQWKIERLHGQSPPQKVTLVRERTDEMGKVVETASSPALEMDNPPWVSWGPIRGEWPVQNWNGGLWRVKAVGGDPKKPAWQSETRMVRVVKPLKFPFTSGSAVGALKVTIDPPADK